MAVPAHDSDSRPGTHAQFQATHWTIVLHAAATSVPGAQDALGQLCQSYWFPIYAYIRRGGIPGHEAKDFTQGFFLHLLEKNLLKQVDRDRGRFRSFLLACLTNFMKDEWRKEKAKKRGGGATSVSIDEEDAEQKYGQLPVLEPDPAKVFDRAWAATVIEQVTQNLRQEYAGKGKVELYEALKGCLSGRLAPDSYPEVAAALGMTRETLHVNVSRFKEAFRRCIRAEISKVVASATEIDDEIRYLMTAWASYLKEKRTDTAAPPEHQV